MGLQGDAPPVKDDASDDTETSSGGVNKKRHLNMYDLVSINENCDGSRYVCTIIVLQLNNGSLSESEVKEDDDHETTGSVNKKDENNMSCDKENIRRKKKKKRKKSGKVLSSHTRSSEDNVEVSEGRFNNNIRRLYLYRIYSLGRSRKKCTRSEQNIG